MRRTRRPKVYYLPNLGHGNCGMIAAFSKADISRVIRHPQSEMVLDHGPPDGRSTAMSMPGQLFVQPITARNGTPWRHWGARHPDYVAMALSTKPWRDGSEVEGVPYA